MIGSDDRSGVMPMRLSALLVAALCALVLMVCVLCRRGRRTRDAPQTPNVQMAARSTRADELLLQKLPTRTITAKGGGDGAGADGAAAGGAAHSSSAAGGGGEAAADGGECAICLMVWAPGDVATRLPCHPQHEFHSHCIKQWLVATAPMPTCPLCKARVL
jgi:hypothetical protein